MFKILWLKSSRVRFKVDWFHAHFHNQQKCDNVVTFHWPEIMCIMITVSSYMQFPCHINLLSRSLTIDCFVKAIWKSSLELWNHWRKTPFPSSCRQRHTHLTHALLFHIFLSIVNYKVFEITCSKVPKCLVFSFLSFSIFSLVLLEICV